MSEYESGGTPDVVSTIEFPAEVDVPTLFLGKRMTTRYLINAQATKSLPHVARYSPASGKGADIFFNATTGEWEDSEPEDAGRFYAIGFSYPKEPAGEPVEHDGESDESGI